MTLIIWHRRRDFYYLRVKEMKLKTEKKASTPSWSSWSVDLAISAARWGHKNDMKVYFAFLFIENSMMIMSWALRNTCARILGQNLDLSTRSTMFVQNSIKNWNLNINIKLTLTQPCCWLNSDFFSACDHTLEFVRIQASNWTTFHHRAKWDHASSCIKIARASAGALSNNQNNFQLYFFRLTKPRSFDDYRTLVDKKAWNGTRRRFLYSFSELYVNFPISFPHLFSLARRRSST